MSAIWWMLLGAAGIVFAALLVLSGGWIAPSEQPIFDVRLAGYDTAAAQAFVDALSAEQRRLYLGVFRTLDTAFPVLLAATLLFGLWILAGAGWRFSQICAAFFAAAYLVADLWENALVAEILRSTATVDADLVARASALTVSKWVTLGLGLYLTGAAWLRGPGWTR
ncbi:MAG: hypothetical protein AAF755_04230 [Pseudomonadota bacterium]